MGFPRIQKQQLGNALIFLLLIQTRVFCYQYKVGDLDAWGIPTSSNPTVYSKWSKYHTFKTGDSLCKFSLFLFLLLCAFDTKTLENETSNNRVRYIFYNFSLLSWNPKYPIKSISFFRFLVKLRSFSPNHKNFVI